MPPTPLSGPWRSRPAAITLYAGVATLAVLVRLVPVLRGGGLGSYGRYDDGVYYTAADSLIHGRVPYRSFVLLHPPALMLALTPFSFLGTLTTDSTGMAVARLAFMFLGAINAMLVIAIAMQWGRRPALVAGVLYACWLPSVYSEQSTLLEPLGGMCLLVALLLLLRARPRAMPRIELVAGVMLGVACVTKIWYVAPMLAVVGCVLAARRYGSALRIVAGAVVSATVIALPFFVLAPTRMWDMVVRDQLLRHGRAASRVGRLSDIVGVKTFFAHDLAVRQSLTVVIFVALTIAAIACFRDSRARVIVVVLMVNLTVLLVSPPYFAHYSALTAAPAALILAIGLGKLMALPRLRQVAVPVMVAALAVCLASGLRIVMTRQGLAFPGKAFAAAAPAGCITADDPEALIQMNRLSSDLTSGCTVPVDVTGATYDSLRRLYPNGGLVPRARNAAFQQFLYRYLVSGSAFVEIRRNHEASPTAITTALDDHQPIASQGTIVLRAGTTR